MTCIFVRVVFIGESVNLRIIKDQFNGCYFLDLDANIDKGFAFESAT